MRRHRTTSSRCTPSVDHPAFEEQKRIARVLGALDDKIELNRRMNQTLEEIARTIFTSWFVRFDPVRAKAAGRQPEGMDAETAALFPDSSVDSDLGPIPAGWNWSTVLTSSSPSHDRLSSRSSAEGLPTLHPSWIWNGFFSGRTPTLAMSSCPIPPMYVPSSGHGNMRLLAD